MIKFALGATILALAFTPVTTTALRLEVTLPPQWSSGIQEWKVR